MQKKFRYILITVLLLLIIPALLVKTPYIQKNLKAYCEKELEKQLKVPVSIKSISGLPPFTLSFEDLVIGKADAPITKISSGTIIPEWYLLITGRIAFLALSLDTVTIDPSQSQNLLKPSSSASPDLHISCRYLSCDHVAFTNSSTSLSLAGSASFSLQSAQLETSLAGKFWRTSEVEKPCYWSLDLDGTLDKLKIEADFLTAPDKKLNNQFSCTVKGNGSFNAPYFIETATIHGKIKDISFINKVDFNGTIQQSNKGLQITLGHIKTFLKQPLVPERPLTRDELSSEPLREVIEEKESFIYTTSLDALISKKEHFFDISLLLNRDIPISARISENESVLTSTGSYSNIAWDIFLTPLESHGFLHLKKRAIPELQFFVEDLRVESSFKNNIFTLNLNAKDISLKHIHQHILNIGYTAPQFTLSTKGSITLNAQGESTFTDKEAQVTITHLTIPTLELEKPFHILWNHNSILVEPFTLNNKTGSLLTGHFNKINRILEAEIRGLDIPFNNTTALLTGSHSFFLALSGNELHPIGKLTGSIKTSLQNEDQMPSQHDTDYELELNDTKVLFNSTTQGDGLKIPTKIDLSFDTHSKRISGDIEGDIELSTISSDFFPNGLQFEGTASTLLTISGDLGQPELRGKVTLSHGKYEVPGAGGILTNIQANATLKGKQVLLSEITADGEKGGTITGSGTIDWSEPNNLQYELLFTPNQIELVNTDLAKVSASGNVTLLFKNDHLDIIGTFTCQDALLDLSSNFGLDTPQLEVIFKNEQNKATKTSPLSFEFDIKIPKNGRVEGRGLLSTWKGHAKVVGTPEKYSVNGHLNCRKGTFRLGSKDLKITHGEALFHGDLLKESYLNVTSSINLPELVASIIVSGPIALPKLRFHSTPPMSEKEIVSWILFNKGFQDISPLQSLQLAQVLISVRQKGKVFTAIDNVRNILGIDHIDIKNRPESNDVSLQLGKHLTDKVMVTVSKELSSEVNRVGVSVDVHPKVRVEAEVGDDAEGIASITWKRDY